MKKSKSLILASLLAIGMTITSFSIAEAATIPTFIPTGSDNTGTIQYWVVPATGVYTLDIYGAAGSPGNRYAGGYGGRAKGDFSLTAGTTLKILVGQQPTAYNSSYCAGGGGGGTFVVTSTGTPLIIAGGGGGGGCNNYGSTGGNGGVILSPIGYTEHSAYQSGSTGDGGGGGYALGGSSFDSSGEGGSSFTAGGAGGFGYNITIPGCGGFGGGGGTAEGGGGGGGAQGGNALYTGSVGSLGGTSYNTGTNQTNIQGVNSSSGSVTITCVPTVPTNVTPSNITPSTATI